MSTTPTPRGPSELVAGGLMLFAALCATGLILKLRLESRSATPTVEAPLTGTVYVPSTTEGVSFVDGDGHLLFVDTEPSGAQVSLDGRAVGETPWSADAECTKDREVKLERAGFKTRVLTVPCRAGTTRISLPLRRR